MKDKQPFGKPLVCQKVSVGCQLPLEGIQYLFVVELEKECKFKVKLSPKALAGHLLCFQVRT